MANLAVIGTFFQRHENSLPLLKRLYIDSTRKPDEAWLMCETEEDAQAIHEAYEWLYDNELLDDWPLGLYVRVVPTPKQENGSYEIIPYSNKINHALALTKADLIVYLDNGSMPSDDKFELMAAGLEANPEWGAVYCGQKRTGMTDYLAQAADPVYDGYCNLNYTQVMHRKTEDRWTLDMNHANPDLADGMFWRSLHQSLGVFYPVAPGRILDEHHIPNAAAIGC